MHILFDLPMECMVPEYDNNPVTAVTTVPAVPKQKNEIKYNVICNKNVTTYVHNK